MQKLFNWYMELPMVTVVLSAIVVWTTLCSVLVSSAIIYYVAAWCIILLPFFLSISYVEYCHEEEKEFKKLNSAYVTKED